MDGWGWMGMDGDGWGWMGMDGDGWGWMGRDGWMDGLLQKHVAFNARLSLSDPHFGRGVSFANLSLQLTLIRHCTY